MCQDTQCFPVKHAETGYLWGEQQSDGASSAALCSVYISQLSKLEVLVTAQRHGEEHLKSWQLSTHIVQLVTLGRCVPALAVRVCVPTESELLTHWATNVSDVPYYYFYMFIFFRYKTDGKRRWGCTVFYPLKPSGHYMYTQLNIQQFYVLPTQCIYVFCVDLGTNSDYFLFSNKIGNKPDDGHCWPKHVFYTY